MMNRLNFCLVVVLLWLMPVEAKPRKKESDLPKPTWLTEESLRPFAFRAIGPALASGRIADFAVNPENKAHYYAAVSSGGVWETKNNGTTWKPIFDHQGSYSIGCIAMDPKRPHVLWVGTGENNSQRSVGYGDGVYRSGDGGETWQHCGLKQSEHIGKIAIHPEQTDTVYVAAQGPLWADGGDRGLYKTVDGGKTWERVLHISEQTGINEVVMDPTNPDILYASAYQRRRHVWTLINGGPESTIYKSTDAGATWNKIEKGLPSVDKGRIGLAMPLGQSHRLYAIVEAAMDKGGVFRTDNGGASWEKMSSYMSQSPQYYNELVVDPTNPDRVFSMDTFLHVSEDGGRHWKMVGEMTKHVDNHAMWLDPQNPQVWLVGCDGGIYESYDDGATWKFVTNLSVTQFYRVAVDNDEPFYNVYGGTQDNNTIGGPSRTNHIYGIANQDWFMVLGGDGFEPQVDPQDPHTVYAQYQHGGLARYNRLTGEKLYIQPMEEPGEDPLKWNWDSPLLISPHHPHRLYFGAQKLFRSDDRGNAWRLVSGDLTKGQDRNAMKVMGRVWSIDAVAKNASTSMYGNLVSLDESPLKEGLIYTGADDGLISVTADGGDTWRKIEKVEGVPSLAYVSDLVASAHQQDRVYATFYHYKMGDFQPYVVVSENQGQTWKSLRGNLPENLPVYCLLEDPKVADLLFIGTEYGVYVSFDRGQAWTKLSGNLPTIAIRDMEIQKREHDLVLASFGRGFFVLDDYQALRTLSQENKPQDQLWQPRDAWYFIPKRTLGYGEKGFQGDQFFTADNPPYGVTFTLYLQEGFTPQKELRQKEEAEAAKRGKDVPYPSWETLHEEEREITPEFLIEITSEGGEVLRRLSVSGKDGFQRVTWDLRLDPYQVVASLKEKAVDNPFAEAPQGPLVIPGSYLASLVKRQASQRTLLTGPVSFRVKPLPMLDDATPHETVARYRKEASQAHGECLGLMHTQKAMEERLNLLEKAAGLTPKLPEAVFGALAKLQESIRGNALTLRGDWIKQSDNQATAMGLMERSGRLMWYGALSSELPTQTMWRGLELVRDELSQVREVLTHIQTGMDELQSQVRAHGGPWVKGDRL